MGALVFLPMLEDGAEWPNSLPMRPGEDKFGGRGNTPGFWEQVGGHIA